MKDTTSITRGHTSHRAVEDLGVLHACMVLVMSRRRHNHRQWQRKALLCCKPLQNCRQKKTVSFIYSSSPCPYVHRAYIHTVNLLKYQSFKCLEDLEYIQYVYTNIRIYMHTYIHTYIQTYICTYIHTNIHTYIRAYICSAVLENAAGFARLDVYIRSCYIMAALGYVYTLGKQTPRFPKRCTSRNATSVEFLEVQIPPCVLMYDWDP